MAVVGSSNKSTEAIIRALQKSTSEMFDRFNFSILSLSLSLSACPSPLLNIGLYD